MSKDNWYRNTDWNDDIETQFLQRLKRSRGEYNKAQYARIQASYLSKEFPKISLKLIDMIITEWPSESHLADTYFLKAKCYIQLSYSEKEIIENFKKSLEQQKIYPNSQNDAYLEYPIFVISNNLKEFYIDAKSVLNENEDKTMFSVDRYKHYLCLAIITDSNGESELARDYADLALKECEKTESGLRYHPTVGLVKEIDQELNEKLIKLSEA